MAKQILFLVVVLCAICVEQIRCPPIDKENKEAHANDKPNPETHDPLLNLEYHRYLREVVNVLETDENFKKMIENASVDDIKTGKIADHLDVVNHTLRTRLDELKRREIERLTEAISRKTKLLNGKDIQSILPKHIAPGESTFDKSDLSKLIRQASVDLDEIDKIRKDEFKKHELEKEYERREELTKLDEVHRKEAEQKHKQEMENHQKHEKVNHPGSKDQLEEVWTDEDKLEEDQFDPNTFFNLHDMNGDGLLDQFEIEALFQGELDKVYNSSDPLYDPEERNEEMNRMREHVMREMDKNGDHIISLEEFLQGTERKEFDQKEEWKTLEDEPQFDEKEFQNFSSTHNPDGHAVNPETHQ